MNIYIFNIYEECLYIYIFNIYEETCLWGQIAGAVTLAVCQSQFYNGFYIYILYIYRQQTLQLSFLLFLTGGLGDLNVCNVSQYLHYYPEEKDCYLG